jgi:type IV secretion system protein VirD4
VTIGGTRAGKGTSAIVPNLCLYPGSVICIDPKGENAKITASRRGHGSKHCTGLGQTVAVLDPYNTAGLPAEYRAAWNPLDLLEPHDPELVDKAASIAEALVERRNAEHAHWDETARLFIKALILYVAISQRRGPHRNLVSVYDLLMRGAVDQLEADRAGALPQPDDPDAFTYLLHLMKRCEECGGVIAGAAVMLLGMGDRELGSVLSTARRNLEFLERPALREVLRSSSFDLDAIKTDPAGMTIYLCLPPQRIPDCGRWLRLMIMACLERMYEIGEAPATGHPVLVLLEEFATLKHMEIIEHAAGYAAGFGVKLWVILQDVTQLSRYYRDGWQTFLGNAGVLQGFANSDQATLEFFSRKLGETEVVQMVRNVTSSLTANTSDPSEYMRVQGFLSVHSPAALITQPLGLLADAQTTGQSASTTTAWNQSNQRVPLLLPDEIERAFKREAMRQLVHIKGERPMALKRQNYFETGRFAGLYDPLTDVGKRTEDNSVQQAATCEAERRRLIGGADAFLRETTAAIRRAKGRA